MVDNQNFYCFCLVLLPVFKSEDEFKKIEKIEKFHHTKFICGDLPVLKKNCCGSMGKNDTVTILYGSETGNCEDYAQFLAKRLQYYGLNPTICAGDEYPIKQLVTKTEFLIVLCSTTGQGELPRNIRKFFKFLLKKKLPNDFLDHVFMTTFGVGDSSYTKFNHAIRKIHARLTQLGCHELSPRAEADELSSEGVDGFYKEWESQLIEGLAQHFEMDKYDESHVLLPVNKVEVDTNGDDIIVNSDLSITRKADYIKIGKIDQVKRITAEDHFQDVRHVVIETPDLNFEPGDSAVLYPVNEDRNVQLFLELQPHWLARADKPLKINGLIDIPGGIIDTSKLTLRTLIKYHLDIMSIPKRSLFITLWHFVDNTTDSGEREQEKLQEFASFEEPEELYNYANRPRRSILETIMEFENNLKIPLEYVYDLFPKIKPRLFSIASKPSPNKIELVVGIVEYKTMLRRIRRGLCSKWLKGLKKGDQIILSIDHAKLNLDLPNIENPPLIMVSPGTGIAPMRSLIQDVVELNKPQSLYLFYGCRFKEKDYLFRDEWQDLVEKNKLHLFPSFSRESKIKYVQDRLFEERNLIGDLILNQNAVVFVCGSSGSMPKQVKLTLIEILKQTGKLSEEDAQSFIFEMEDNGRYKEDTW